MNVVRRASNGTLKKKTVNRQFELLKGANLLVAVPPLDYSHFVDVVFTREDGVSAICGAVVLVWKTHWSQYWSRT